MAGHSKWANIQHRKGRQDAKRGKIFTKLGTGRAKSQVGLDIGGHALVQLVVQKQTYQVLTFLAVHSSFGDRADSGYWSGHYLYPNPVQHK